MDQKYATLEFLVENCFTCGNYGKGSVPTHAQFLSAQLPPDQIQESLTNQG